MTPDVILIPTTLSLPEFATTPSCDSTAVPFSIKDLRPPAFVRHAGGEHSTPPAFARHWPHAERLEMRLLNVHTLALEDSWVSSPNYAILSHTWGTDEVSFQEMSDPARARQKIGFSKIRKACDRAQSQGHDYLWIDTCCIDRSSSAELTEAINSMSIWYKNASVCYAYLEDLTPSTDEHNESRWHSCRWFTRGWTLQELIAPAHVEFYDRDWTFRGQKSSPWMLRLLSDITSIEEEILLDSNLVRSLSVARRMSWAAGRQCSRIEDIAYCLLGIFEVNMPLLYGEGPRAFRRLQEEIIKQSTDLSLFAWKTSDAQIYRGILAKSPSEFSVFREFSACRSPFDMYPESFSMTNLGLHMTGKVSRWGSGPEYVLDLCLIGKGGRILERVGILIREAMGSYVRFKPQQLVIVRDEKQLQKMTIYLQRDISAYHEISIQHLPHSYTHPKTFMQSDYFFGTTGDRGYKYRGTRSDYRLRSQPVGLLPADSEALTAEFPTLVVCPCHRADLGSNCMTLYARYHQIGDRRDQRAKHSSPELVSPGVYGTPDSILSDEEGNSIDPEGFLPLGDLDAELQTKLDFWQAFLRTFRCSIVDSSGYKQQTGEPFRGTSVPDSLTSSRPRKRARVNDAGSSDDSIGFPQGNQDSKRSFNESRYGGHDPLSLACPFYKKDKIRHFDCWRYKLRRIRDVKQHIYRRHTQPYYCPVCHSIFTEITQRDAHIISRSCQPSDETAVLEGITSEQKQRLNERVHKTISESDQWFQVWEIIFPGATRPSSPYVGNDMVEVTDMLRDFWQIHGTEFVDEFLRSRHFGPGSDHNRGREMSETNSISFADVLASLPDLMGDFLARFHQEVTGSEATGSSSQTAQGSAHESARSNSG